MDSNTLETGKAIRFDLLSPMLIAIAAVLVLLETFYFALQRTNYSHIANTISELGETGAPPANLIAFSFFLPVGLLVWLALWLVHCGASDKNISFILLALSCLGAGYVGGAFFPCDPGAPLFGTWRTQIHNVFGFMDYAGTGVGFLAVAKYFARRNAIFQAVAFLVAGLIMFICVALLMVEATFPIRGAIQRVAEAIQFMGVFFVCLVLRNK